MHDSSILPLLTPNSSSRRRRSLHLSDLLRFIFRRGLKFYVFFIILIFLFALTILHKANDRSHDHRPFRDKKDIISGKSRFEARTMKTIIGRYVGPTFSTELNVSREMLDANNYDPDPNMGKNGRPVYLPGYPKDQMQALFSINRFNLAVSDRIPVDRKLPDARKLTCRKMKTNEAELPSTSVIIVFHNEAWSTLVRTVHSVLNNSPHNLLAEILLVDDASDRKFLGKTLENYMINLSSVWGVNIRVLRSKQRIGLVRSRLIGVEVAKGKVLTFLDAHCEATIGWLQPLLQQVLKDPKSAACPIIDIINEDTFAYTRSFELHMGAFNWGLNFRWFPISRREIVASNIEMKGGSLKSKTAELVHPFNTPIMAGGLFSIDKDYFNQLGKYDKHMDIWGGENIELSLRIWQCGGEIKIVPCSHVAHVFRKSSPYTFRLGKEVGDILYTNLARVAEVWMDDWRNFFFNVNPIVNKTLNKVGYDVAFTEIEERKKLRLQLKCKSFKWFLDNVWPEHFFPSQERFFGKIKQTKSGKCLQRPLVRSGSGTAPVGPPTTARCSSKLMGHQLFVYNQKRKFLMSDENVCLDSGSDPIPTRQIILAPCSESQRQKWNHNSTSDWLVHEVSGLCLSSSEGRVHLNICDIGDESLNWTFMEENWQ